MGNSLLVVSPAAHHSSRLLAGFGDPHPVAEEIRGGVTTQTLHPGFVVRTKQTLHQGSISPSNVSSRIPCAAGCTRGPLNGHICHLLVPYFPTEGPRAPHFYRRGRPSSHVGDTETPGNGSATHRTAPAPGAASLRPEYGDRSSVTQSTRPCGRRCHRVGMTLRRALPPT